MIVYQIFTRLFGNRNTTRKEWGSVAENGSGKMNDIDAQVLKRIKAMGVTHVWFTGVLRHASQTDYTAYGIPAQNAEVVKGRAGSPYAITDYYDLEHRKDAQDGDEGNHGLRAQPCGASVPLCMQAQGRKRFG